MNILELTDPEFIRISALTPYEVRRELQNKSPEWRFYYDKLKRKQRNTAYHSNAKDINNAKRREKRRENKAIETMPTIINLDDVDTTIKPEIRANLKIDKLNPNSINNYISTIKAIYNKYHTDTIADDAEVLKLLNNEKYNPTKLLKQNMYIIHNIKDIATNTPHNIKNLYGIFSRLNGKNINLFRNTIYPYFVEYRKVYDENRDKAVANTDLTSKISFDTDAVIINSENIVNLYDRLIYMLLFLIPTRRLYDYRIARIAKKSGDINNLNYNWYYQGNIYINNTKNKDMMILDLPVQIIDLINKLPLDTDYIFGKLYSESSLSEKFRKITTLVYGTPFNALDIRKLYASHNLKTNATTGNTRILKENARKMGHSISQNLDYVVKT